MELITYVKWTNPGEKAKFEECIRTTKDDTELLEQIKSEFSVDTTTAFTVIRRFEKLIKTLRK